MFWYSNNCSSVKSGEEGISEILKCDNLSVSTWFNPEECGWKRKVENIVALDIKTVLLYHVGLVQKQTREVEEAEKVFIRGIRELSEMEQIDQNVRRENRGE